MPISLDSLEYEEQKERIAETAPKQGLALDQLIAQGEAELLPMPEPEPSIWERLRAAGGAARERIGEAIQQVGEVQYATKQAELQQSREIGRNLTSGFLRSAAGTSWLAANASMLTKDFLQSSRERMLRTIPAPRGGPPVQLPETIQEPQALENAAEWFEDYWRTKGEELMQSAREKGSEDVFGQIVQTAGGLPLSLAEAATAATVAGPIVGFGALGALGAADQGWHDSLKEGLKGAFLGSIFKATGGAPATGRALAIGGTAAALAREAEPVERGIQTATMATLAALPAGRRRWEAERREGVETPEEQQFRQELEAIGTELEVPRPEMMSMAAPAEAGDQWIGRVEGIYDPVAVEIGNGTKPIRRDEVLARFVKDMGQPIYQGRVRRGLAGYFKPRTREMAIAKHGDLEAVAHEMGHEVDIRYPEVQAGYRHNIVIEKELKDISYNREDAAEGWGEFNRLWLTQPEVAHRVAPRTEALLQELFVKDPNLEKAYLRAQKGMTSWLAQDALTRARSKAGPELQLDDIFDSKWAEWRQALIDDTYGLERMQAALDPRGIAGVPAQESAIKTARAMRASSDLANAALKYGAPKLQPDGRITAEGPGLIDIFKLASSKGGKRSDWIHYMIGRRAKELKPRGKEHRYEDDEIEAMVALETPEFKAAAAQYQTFNQKVVQFVVDNGVISQDDADAMSKYFYIPFFREARPRMGRRGALQGAVRAVREITGGTGAIRDPAETMIENMGRLIDLAVRNEAYTKAIELADMPGGGRFMRPVARTSMPVQILTQDAKDAFRKEYLRTQIENKTEEFLREGRPGAARAAEEWAKSQKLAKQVDLLWNQFGDTMTMWQRGLTPRGDRLIGVMKDGKAQYYQVLDPLLWRSFLAFHRPNRTNPIMRLMMMVKALRQYTITRDPAFAGGNIARDQFMGGVMGRYRYLPFLDGIAGMHMRIADMDSYYKPAITSARAMQRSQSHRIADRGMRMEQRIAEDRQMYRDFRLNLGGMGGLYSPQRVRVLTGSALRQKGLRPEGLRQFVLDTPIKLKHALDEASMAFELGTRLGLYRRAIKAGAHPREAAYEAKDITDFSRRGDSEALRFFLDTVPFFNAAIQGLDRFALGVWREPGNRARVWRGIGLVALVSGINAAHNYGNPLYENESDASKDFYWHFFPPSLDYLRRMAKGEIEQTTSELIDIINAGGKAGQETEQFRRAADALDELKTRYVHYRYPKPWELGSIATAAERTIEGALNRLPKKAALDIARVLLANMHFSPVPAAIEPFAESVAGIDFFTWQRITPESLERLEPGYRARPTTPLVLKKAGEATGISPVEMEHYLRSFFSGWASAGFQLADWGLFDQPPDMSIDVNPLTRRFTRGRATGIKPKQDLYQLHRDLGQLVATFDYLRDDGRINEARAYAEAHPEMNVYPLVHEATQVLRRTGAALSMTQNARDLETVQEIAEHWVPAVRGPQRLQMVQAGPIWKDRDKLKKWLIDEMKQAQNLSAVRAMRVVKEIQP